jgi:hypothetical protein
MKTLENLDLSSYGVEEMSSSEINETDGGCLFAFICIGIIVGLAALSAANGNLKGKSNL